MTTSNPNDSGQTRLPSREGLEGIPESYERIQWKERLVTAGASIIGALAVLALLWYLDSCGGG